MCLAEGQITPATVADHVVPHRCDPECFRRGELQSLCATCHNLSKQSHEKPGTNHLAGCDEHGEPLFFTW